MKIFLCNKLIFLNFRNLLLRVYSQFYCIDQEVVLGFPTANEILTFFNLCKKMEDVNKKITLIITLVTGGTFTLNVDSDISVELLKKIVSKKLKVNKERICLMNSER